MKMLHKKIKVKIPKKSFNLKISQKIMNKLRI